MPSSLKSVTHEGLSRRTSPPPEWNFRRAFAHAPRPKPRFSWEVPFSGMRKTKRTPSALEEGVLRRGAVSGLGVILRTGLPERFVPWRRPCIVILTVAGLCRLHTGFLPSANLSITAKRGFSLSVALFLR